jgi:hypothetical protein
MRLDQFFFGSRSSPLDPFVSSNLLVDMGRRCTIVLQADPEYFGDFRRVLALGQTGAKYAFRSVGHPAARFFLFADVMRKMDQ